MPNLRLTLRGRFFLVLAWRCSFRTLGPWSFPYSTWPSTRLAPASLPRDPMSFPATSPASSSAVSPHMWVNIFFYNTQQCPTFPKVECTVLQNPFESFTFQQDTRYLPTKLIYIGLRFWYFPHNVCGKYTRKYPSRYPLFPT